MSSDDDKVHSEIVRRVVKVAAVFGFFLLVLLGFYAEIAMTRLVCGMLGLGDSAGLVQAATFITYAAAVIVAIAYATDNA